MLKIFVTNSAFSIVPFTIFSAFYPLTLASLPSALAGEVIIAVVLYGLMGSLDLGMSRIAVRLSARNGEKAMALLQKLRREMLKNSLIFFSLTSFLCGISIAIGFFRFDLLTVQVIVLPISIAINITSSYQEACGKFKYQNLIIAPLNSAIWPLLFLAGKFQWSPEWVIPVLFVTPKIVIAAILLRRAGIELRTAGSVKGFKSRAWRKALRVSLTTLLASNLDRVILAFAQPPFTYVYLALSEPARRCVAISRPMLRLAQAGSLRFFSESRNRAKKSILILTIVVTVGCYLLISFYITGSEVMLLKGQPHLHFFVIAVFCVYLILQSISSLMFVQFIQKSKLKNLYDYQERQIFFLSVLYLFAVYWSIFLYLAIYLFARCFDYLFLKMHFVKR